MAANTLPTEVKIYIVQQLAMWELPSVIQKAVKEFYGVEITIPGIIHYDGSKGKPGKKWKQLFDEARREFVDNVNAIPIANKAFRIRELNELYANQKRRPALQRNSVEMRAALEQAAKESGGVYTNRTEHTGKDGKPLIPKAQNVVVFIPDNGRGDVAGVRDAESGVTADSNGKN